MIQKKNKLTLLNDELCNCYINKFVGETLNHAVLDSVCTKTVCGLSWLDNYLETLSPEDREKLVEKQIETKFKFGDCETVGSLKSVIIPAQISNSKITIQTDVVSNELPLLLRKDAMKKANTKIDFTNDKINILGQEMDIRLTTSGHYSIPISKCYEALNKFSEENYGSILLSIDNMALKTRNEKRKISEKLHQQFGHSSTSKILKLVKTSGIEDNELFELIDELGEDCLICLKYKKAPLKPVLGVPLSKHFNDVI